MGKHEEITGWVPVLSEDGQFYCSPRCGSGKFCRREWYDIATARATELATRMGDGWTPHVWENLGWHYSAQRLDGERAVAEIYPSEDRNADFEPGVGYPTKSYIAMVQTAPQFIAHAADPQDALGFAMQDARTALGRIESDLAHIGDFPTKEGDHVG